MEKRLGAAGSNSASSVPEIPRFVVDLDLPPEKRWAGVCQRFKKVWPKLLAGMVQSFEDADDSDECREFTESFHNSTVEKLSAFGCEYLLDELRTIADAAEVSLADLMVLQFTYEATCGCMSVVALETLKGSVSPCVFGSPVTTCSLLFAPVRV